MGEERRKEEARGTKRENVHATQCSPKEAHCPRNFFQVRLDVQVEAPDLWSSCYPMVAAVVLVGGRE